MTGLKTDWPRWLEWAAMVALLAIFSALACLFILSPSPSVIGQEQNSVFAVLRYQLTGTLFTEPDQFPFNVLQYGPVHYQFIRFVAGAFNLDPVAAHIYRVGRVLSVLANILTVGVLWLGLRRLSSMSANAAALLSIGTLFALMPWGFVIHPDPLHTLLVVCAVMLTLLAGPSISVGAVGLSCGIIAVAIFVKLTAICFLPLPLVLAMLHPRPRAHPVPYMIAALLACIPAVLIFGTGTIARNWMVALQQPVDVRVAVLGTYLSVLQRQFVLAAAVLLAVITAIRMRAALLGGVVLCAIWSGGVGLLLGLKVGAGPNYFLLFVVFAFLAGGVFAFPASSSQTSAPGDEVGKRLSFTGLVLLYAGVQIGWIWSHIDNARSDRTGEFASLQQVLQAIPDPRGAILELDGNLPIVAADRVMLATSDVVSWTAMNTRLAHGSLVTMLRRHQVCWAIVAHPTWEAMNAAGTSPHMSSAQMAYLREVRSHFDDVLNLPARVLMRAKICDPNNAQ